MNLKTILLFILIIIGMIIIFFLLIPLKSENSNPQNNIAENSEEQVTSSQGFEEESNTSESGDGTGSGTGDGTGSGGSEGSSGGSSTSSSTDGTSQNPGNCITQQISYSLQNFNTNETCNQLQSGICIDKTVICSLTIHNLDENIGGNFEIEFIVYEEGEDPTNPISSITSQTQVAPESQQPLSRTFNIQSSGEQGNANLDLVCSFTTLQVPTEEICS